MAYSFAEINGTTLHYQVRGSGPALVLIHAGIAHLAMWDDQIDVFAERYQVIRYDVRGFGQSPQGAGAYTDHDDLAGLLHHLGISQASLVGVSNGGRIALDFALAYPAMVKGLILVGALPTGYQYIHLSPEIEAKDAAIEAAFEQGDIDRAAELEVQFWVDGLKRSPAQIDPQVRARAVEMSAHTFRRQAEPGSGERHPLEPAAISRLSQINAPAFIIAGDCDLPDVIECAHQLAIGLSGSKVAIMPDVAHLPNMERPVEFNRLVLPFLTGLKD
jgi:pimeloyl-ACP methyl ester carboxylesterase